VNSYVNSRALGGGNSFFSPEQQTRPPRETTLQHQPRRRESEETQQFAKLQTNIQNKREIHDGDYNASDGNKNQGEQDVDEEIGNRLKSEIKKLLLSE